MAETGPADYFTRFRTALAEGGRTDAELIDEFAVTRSEAAFGELVRRFAPMVWGVCRRTVGHRHTAEDAFQAVFLVLLRKPSSVRPAVGGWLHTVARHTAVRALAKASRRRATTVPPGFPAPEPAELPDADDLRVLDEEVARLPDLLRTAVALCELGGVGRREAAERLGVAEGTLSSRLATARKTLAARLRGRGVVLGAAGASILPGAAAEAAPPVLSPVPETVSALADGVMRTMLLNSWKRPAAGLLAASAVGLGIAAVPVTADAPKPPPVPAFAPATPRAVAPNPRPAREGHILLWLDEKPQLLKPDGTELPSPEAIPKAQFGLGAAQAKLSPDGTWLAFEQQDGVPIIQAILPPPPIGGAQAAAVPAPGRSTILHILGLDGKEPSKTLPGIHLNAYFWLDAKTLIVRGQEIDDKGSLSKTLANWVYNSASEKRSPLKVPEKFHIRAVAPDGKSAIVDEWHGDAKSWTQQIHKWTLDTDKPVPLLAPNQSIYDPAPQYSPDGKKLLCRLLHYGIYTPLGNGVFRSADFQCNDIVVVDLATKQRTVIKVLGRPPGLGIAGLAWSPDGSKIAFVEATALQDGRGSNQYRVNVADPDGKNSRTIYATEGLRLVGFDWK